VTQPPAPLPGRPLYVSVAGGKLYVSAHDAFHLQTQRDFKRRIRAAHPDHHHSIWAHSRTRKLLTARSRWEEAEARWYAHLWLDPPVRGVRGAGRDADTDRVPPMLRPFDTDVPSSRMGGNERTPTSECVAQLESGS